MNIISKFINRDKEISLIKGRPISEIKRKSHNIWDEEVEIVGGVLWSKNFIKVNQNETYYVKTPEDYIVRYYDSNKTLLSYESMESDTTFTTPSDCEYIKFNVDNAYGTTYHNDISINFPETFTSYEPHYLGVFKFGKKKTTTLKTNDAINIGIQELEINGNHTGGSRLPAGPEVETLVDIDKLYVGGVNQAFQYGDFATDIWVDNGVTHSISNGVIEIAPQQIAAKSVFYSPFTTNANHKYYFSYEAKANVSSLLCGYGTNGTYKTSIFTANETWQRFSDIDVVPSASGELYIYIYASALTDKLYVKNYIVIDLTQMYGAGNEPTSVDEIKKDISKSLDANGYLPYQNNNQTITLPTDLKSNEKLVMRRDRSNNAWDESIKLGMWGGTEGPEPSEDSLCSANYIEIKPNQKYIFVGGVDDTSIFEYDMFKNYFNQIILTDGENTFTTDSNTCYITFNLPSTYGTTYNNDISIIPLYVGGDFESGKLVNGVETDVTDEDVYEYGGIFRTEFYNCLPNKDYYLCNDYYEYAWVFYKITYYNILKEFISVVQLNKDSTFTSPNNAYYYRLESYGYDDTTASALVNKAYYQKYQDLNGMGVYKVIENDITNADYNYNNIVYYRFPKPNASKMKGLANGVYQISGLIIDNAIDNWDDANKIGHIFAGADYDYMWVGFPIGTTLTQAKSALSGKLLHYELKPEYTQDKVFKANKIGSVDLGSIEWVYIDGAFGNFSQITDRKTYPFEGQVIASCSKYSVNPLALYNGDPRWVDKQIMINWSNTTVWIKDSDYTDATAFKNSLNGVILYYELATPTTTDLTSSSYDLLNSKLYSNFNSLVAKNSNVALYSTANTQFWKTINGIPDGYKEVNYFQATQFYDSGWHKICINLPISSNNKVLVEMEWYADAQVNYYGLFYASGLSNVSVYALADGTYSCSNCSLADGQANSWTPNTWNIVRFIISKNDMRGVSEFNFDGVINSNNMKLKRVIVYSYNSVLQVYKNIIRDIVACVRESDNVAGMFQVISGEWYDEEYYDELFLDGGYADLDHKGNWG